MHAEVGVTDFGLGDVVLCSGRVLPSVSMRGHQETGRACDSQPSPVQPSREKGETATEVNLDRRALVRGSNLLMDGRHPIPQDWDLDSMDAGVYGEG